MAQPSSSDCRARWVAERHDGRVTHLRGSVVGLGILVALAGCASPTGGSVPGCDASWADAPVVIVATADEEAIPVSIECMSEIDDRRIRIGLRLPPGPSCHALSALRIREGPDAVSVTADVVAVNDPLAGACADEPMRVVTEADLQAAVGDRALLDGSQ